MSLLNPKNIDWNRLKSIHDQYRSTLRGIDTDRRELIRLYPDLLKKRKEANLNRKTALETASTFVKTIYAISLRIKELRSDWINNGGSKENFYLNLEANRKLAKFAELKTHRKEIRLTNPKKTETVFRQTHLECEGHLQTIKLARLNYRNIQRLMDDNSTVQVVVQYKKEVAHHYDAYLELQRFQLSIRKEKIHIANKVVFVKDRNIWFKVDRNGELTERCTPIEVRDIERRINKYLRRTTENKVVQ